MLLVIVTLPDDKGSAENKQAFLSVNVLVAFIFVHLENVFNDFVFFRIKKNSFTVLVNSDVNFSLKCLRY